MSERTATARLARAVIRRHSRSFALASWLLPRSVAADAEVLYAYCRRADDAIDLCAPEERLGHLAMLRAQVDAMYSAGPIADPVLAAMRDLVSRRSVPRACLDEFLAGMQMDASAAAYETFGDLLVYCHRVAGTVGLMMSHVMGVRSRRALVHAAHLGIAMQLTNVARDVCEDWGRGRLYLPLDMLRRAGADDPRASLGQAFPADAVAATRTVTRELLARAEDYYRSGDAGIAHLPARCALAVRAARLIYSRIGARIRADGCHPLATRAVVSTRRKLALVARAALEAGLRALASMLRPRLRIPDEAWASSTSEATLPGLEAPLP